MMYEAVRGALAADDALETKRADPRFRVRQTPEWKKHAADIEVEMLKRGVRFILIDWTDGQDTLLFDRDFEDVGPAA
jgi:hypothetical protein